MNKRHTAYTSGFVAFETIAIIIVVVLVVVVTAAIIFTPQFGTDSVPAPVDTVPQERSDDVLNERRDVQYVTEDSPFVEGKAGKTGEPTNVLMFQEKRESLLRNLEPEQLGQTGPSRFSGTISSIDTTNGLTLMLKSTLPGPQSGLTARYVFSQDDVSKIRVEGGTINDLNVGDSVHIDQTFDISQESYSNALQDVLITTL